MTEKFEDIKMKYVILETWKNKLGYPLNYKDLEELENIIDYYEVENQELKKQLENKYSRTGTLTNEVLYEENTKLINQQKEFIEYLENEINTKDYYIKHYADGDDYASFDEMELVQEILSKYKEIIGSDINVGSKGGKDE